MMGRSHVLVGGAGYLTLAAMAPGALGHLPPAQLAAGAVCAGAASLLPDLDCPGSTIARALGPLSDLLARLVSLIGGGHRNGTHSLLAWLAVSVGFTLALGTRHGVALVGASMGGSAALIAAARVKPPVDPVVELSGQAKPTGLPTSASWCSPVSSMVSTAG